MEYKFKCPMMCGMQMMHQQELLDIQPEMQMEEDVEMDNYYEDEEDDRQFMKMYPESCRKIMIYVKLEIDRMEEKDEMIYTDRPDKEMVDMMTDNAFRKMVKEIPEMADEEEKRQYPRRSFSRDLLRLLLLNELLRRRRRRRRDYYGYLSEMYSLDNNYFDYYYD